MPIGPTLRSLLERFRDFGSAPAVISPDSKGVSFEQLFGAALARARELAERGVRPGMRVAVLGPNTPDWVVCFWAIVAAEAVAVPLDARASDDDVIRMMRRVGCRFGFVTPARQVSLGRLLQDCEILPLELGHPTAVGRTAAAAEPSAHPDDVAVIIYTSGTTGSPKAVPLTHRNVLSNVKALVAENLAGSHDRVVLPLPLHHIYPLTVGLLTPLACGAAVVLVENVSGPQFVTAMSVSRATILIGVPRLYTALISNIRTRLRSPARWALAISRWLRRRAGVRIGRMLFGAARKQVGPKLRLLVSGGAALDVEDEEILLSLGWDVLTGYGLSETSPILTFNRRHGARAGTAGKPLPGTEIRIAAADDVGIGEIEALGPGVFSGYLDDPTATRAAFTEDGWFRTGDLGRIDEANNLYVVARQIETIVLASGKKLFPGRLRPPMPSIP